MVEMDIKNIGKPTDPKWNKFLVVCNTNGLALVATGLGADYHSVAYFGGALILIGTLGVFFK